MAAVARGLAGRFQVVEPFQRGSGGGQRSGGAGRLSVRRHVADLHEVIESCRGRGRPALVGSSWGAMLALAYAAEHPLRAGPLVLIGCGPFARWRARLLETLDERIDEGLRRKLEAVAEEVADADEQMRTKAALIAPLYSYEPVTSELEIAGEIEEFDARAHQESWDDMESLAESFFRV